MVVFARQSLAVLIIATLFAGCMPQRLPANIRRKCMAPRASQMALNVDFQGVWTNPNAHSKVPAGAAARAENLVNERPGVASTVAGQETLPDEYSAEDERLSSGITFDGCLVESTSGATPRLYVRDVGAETLTPESGSFSPPSGVVRIPMAIADEKLFLATDEGVQELDGVAATPAVVGIPPALSIAVNGSGSGSLLDTDESVAYRYTISRVDASGKWRRGIPSGRTVWTTGAPDSPALIVTLPEGLTEDDRLEIWRTGIAASGSTPGDTMFLVSQTYVDMTQYDIDGINNIDDITPDELRGEPLYTNATSGGVLRQNERPPMAKALVAFDGYLILGNVEGPERFTVRLLAVPDAGDIVTVAGVAYEFINGVGTTNQVTRYASGTVSENIYYTSLNFANTINFWQGVSPARTMYAFYGSSEGDPPGIIHIESRDVAASPFTVVASANGDRFEPPLSAAQTSLATTEPNGLWFSKRGEPYAFPPLRSASATYRIRVGTSGRPILGMAALRDAVIVFVDREGVFKVKRTGAESWRVDQINNNAHLLVPDSVAVVDNQVIAWTTRGLVAVDEGGVEEIDLPIKDKIQEIRALGQDTVLPLTFGIGDEDRLRYILYHPLTTDDTYATHAWVYNADNGTWTERTDPASGGFVGQDDALLYLGSATSNTITRERTGTAAQRFQDPDGAAIPVRLEWTVMDEGDPGAVKQFTELRLLTREEITGSVTFNCTNDLKGTRSTTGRTSLSADGEPFVYAWVPNGCQRTSRLKVDIQRDVLGENFEVVGMKTTVADMYPGALKR
jgi:hypothetical protein